MKQPTFYFTAVLAIFLSLAALGIRAAVDMPATLMSRGDYQLAKRAIEAGTRLTIASCRTVQGGEREICKAEARAGERVRLAELQARYHGTVAALEDARLARVRAAYDVARARCTVHQAGARVACLREAREGKTRALAEAVPAST